jgi:mono/diheme cytochrome c family protein
MLTSNIVCPNCAARLKITGKIEEGKRISCPKCSASFAVPQANGSPAPAGEKPARATKTASASKDDDSQEKIRPPGKKKKRLPEQAKPSDKLAKLIFAAAGVLVYVVGAAGLVLLIRLLGPPPEDTGRAVPARPAPGPRAAGGGVPIPRPGGPPASPPTTPVGGAPGAAVPANAAAQAGSSQPSAAGKELFARFCVKCHTLDPAGEPRKKDLSTVGSDSTHTVEWLMAFIANPKSQKPDIKMPAFAQQLSQQDLRALAEYLASLK